jgi:hypothetical protein
MSGEEGLQCNIMEGDKEKLRRSLEGPGLVTIDCFMEVEVVYGLEEGSHMVISIQ